MSIKKIIYPTFFLFILLLSNRSFASLSTHVRIYAVKGTVTTQLANGNNGQCTLKRTLNVTECRVINQSVFVETGDDSYAEIEYRDGSKLKLAPNSKIRLEQNNIYVFNGQTWFKVEKQKDGLIIKTPDCILGIRGTEFIVKVEDSGKTTTQLIEGSIEVSDINRQSQMLLSAGMEVTIEPGSSVLKTKIFQQNDNQKWWTDWPTLVPISEKPGYQTPSVSTTSGGRQLSPVADAYVYAYNYLNWNRSNRGKYEQLVAGWNPIGGESRAYLKFDISNLNPSDVKKATLRLFHFSTSGNSNVRLGVYRVSDPWLEGNDTYHSGQTEKTAAPGELSWVQQPVFNSSLIAEFNPGANKNNWVDVDITVLVRNWLAGFKNNGLVIKPVDNLSSSTGESLYHFASREFEKGGKSPVLLINGTNAVQQTEVIDPLIVGDWKWFTNAVVTIHPDGTVTGSNGDTGKWTTNTSGSPYNYTINWTSGYIDKLNLVGQTLKGENQNGTTVWGEKIIPSANQNNSEIPQIAGEWEITCNDGNIYKYNLNIIQHGQNFYADMVRINGSEANSKIEGQILRDGSIKFIRSRGNWKQYYVGNVVKQSGGKGFQIGGTNGKQETRGFTWNATKNIDLSSAGTWIINQDNGYTGNMTLQQNQSGRVTGSVIWNGTLKGTITGEIIGDRIELTIDYHNGDLGYYKGTFAQNRTQIVNGTTKGNNGVSANWNAHR